MLKSLQSLSNHRGGKSSSDFIRWQLRWSEKVEVGPAWMSLQWKKETIGRTNKHISVSLQELCQPSWVTQALRRRWGMRWGGNQGGQEQISSTIRRRPRMRESESPEGQEEPVDLRRKHSCKRGKRAWLSGAFTGHFLFNFVCHVCFIFFLSNICLFGDCYCSYGTISGQSWVTLKCSSASSMQKTKRLVEFFWFLYNAVQIDKKTRTSRDVGVKIVVAVCLSVFLSICLFVCSYLSLFVCLLCELCELILSCIGAIYWLLWHCGVKTKIWRSWTQQSKVGGTL